jgi:carboxyl-terminal processing protease
MKLKPSVLFFSFLGVVGFALFYRGALPMFQKEPNPRKEARLVQTILEGIARLHFMPRAVNDDFSKDVMDIYLEDMDAYKRLFTVEDIQLLRQHELMLDDQAQEGRFDFFNLSSERYQAALTKTQGFYREILANPLQYSINEMLETDYDRLEWAVGDVLLKQRWEQWMKYEVLRRIHEELNRQSKPDFTGEQKDFEALEPEMRAKVLDTYDKFYKRLMKADRTKLMEGYLNALTNAFDPHTGYFSPQDKENFDIQMSGKLEGIGARLQSDGEKTTVTEVVVGGPAWKEGSLQAKDVIVKVGQESGEDVDVMGWEIDDVVSKIRGPKGTKVHLVVRKPDGSERDIVIVRDVVIMEEGLAKSLILYSKSAGTDRIGYIYLPKFYADFTPQGTTSCAADVAKELEKLKAEGVRGVILDLRNNGGGSLRDVVQMSGLFIEQGPIVQVKSRNRDPEIMEDRDSRVQWGGPLVVMVNSFSASASEILAAAMKDYGRAVIVGASGTYGKGTVQRFLDLDNATNDPSVKPLGEMKLTVQKFYRINGSTTQLNGVEPDIVLPDTWNLITDLGERENKYAMQANTISPVRYKQQVYTIANIGKLRASSQARVLANPTFQLVEENARRMHRQRDNTAYPLNASAYETWSTQQREEAKRFEDMFGPIDGFEVANLSVDLAQISADTSRSARNEDWIKERRKDVQLHESMRIMLDMMRMDSWAGK